MLPSEFNAELGALIRRLFLKVDVEPRLPETTAKDHIERAIIALVSLYLSLDE